MKQKQSVTTLSQFETFKILTKEELIQIIGGNKRGKFKKNTLFGNG